ncbi:SDR family NAD(P)-dependent oxidoreductase [Epilithonimonas sp.]|uniref:SDR family NAD(P)-dependent oxidoreductase n=1 Tax=Epilithonimonas sp. TaxID=2894511 RepID=UPI002FDF0241
MEKRIDERSLKGKTVVITGASSGVGRAIAEAFALEGCQIVLAARGQEALEETLRLCEDLEAKAIAVSTDVSLYEDVQHLTQERLSIILDELIFGSIMLVLWQADDLKKSQWM